jgi:hypothetical protein
MDAGDQALLAAVYGGLCLAGVGISNATTSIMQGKKIQEVSKMASG